MVKQWILVAHRGGAKILEHVGRKQDLSLVMQLDNPRGTLKNQELKSDKPGRVGSSDYAGLNPCTTEEQPREHVLSTFVKSMVDTLEHACSAGLFDQLFLVAEPHLLGKLRSEIGPTVNKKVAGSLAKDLVHVRDQELYGYVAPMLKS